MSDATTTQVLHHGKRNVVIKFTNISDGTGEAAVKKVDVSAFTTPATGVKIERIDFFMSGMGVDILWDATANVVAFYIPQDAWGSYNMVDFGGIPNNSGAGSTGDILFTTTMQQSGDRYTIILHMVRE